jgi:hypothetical protein
MGNPHRGDTPIEAGSESFTLCYDLNAIALIMARFSISDIDELARLQEKDKQITFSDLIFILWAGLQHHHEELTEKQVGALDWDLETASLVVGGAFQKSLMRSSPAKGAGGRDPKAKRSGTGR